MQDDRMRWLLKTLRSKGAARQQHEQLTLHLDGTDTVALCDAEEMQAKASRLFAGSSSDGVIVSGETKIWPRDLTFGGQRLDKIYPRPPGRAAQYLNVGASISKPSALAKLLRCLEDRYGFPHRCPLVVSATGEIERNVTSSTEVTWFHGTLKGEWGWEQACWNMYVVEQQAGLLPSSCPPIIFDYDNDLFLHLPGVEQQVMWGMDGRAVAPSARGRPCIIHAPGASKFVLPSLTFWWDCTHAAHATSGVQRQHACRNASMALNYFRQNLVGMVKHPSYHQQTHLQTAALAYFKRRMLPQLSNMWIPLL